MLGSISIGRTLTGALIRMSPSPPEVSNCRVLKANTPPIAPLRMIWPGVSKRKPMASLSLKLSMAALRVRSPPKASKVSLARLRIVLSSTKRPPGIRLMAEVANPPPALNSTVPPSFTKKAIGSATVPAKAFSLTTPVWLSSSLKARPPGPGPTPPLLSPTTAALKVTLVFPPKVRSPASKLPPKVTPPFKFTVPSEVTRSGASSPRVPLKPNSVLPLI